MSERISYVAVIPVVQFGARVPMRFPRGYSLGNLNSPVCR